MGQIGSQIRKLREIRGLSQAEVARCLKISANRYNRYELDQREPDIETLKKIAKELGVTMNELVGYDGGELKIPLLNESAVVDWIHSLHEAYLEREQILSTRLYSIFEKAKPEQLERMAELCEKLLVGPPPPKAVTDEIQKRLVPRPKSKKSRKAKAP